MTEPRLNRRSFLRGSALLSGGAAIGWLLGHRQPATSPPPAAPPGNAPFAYDLSALVHTDPALLIGRHLADIPLQFQRVRRLAVLPDDRVLVAGDTHLKVAGGATLLSLGRPPLCLAVAANLYVGFTDHVETFDLAGAPVARWPSLGPNAHLTSIAPARDFVFLADAGNREILRCDLAGNIQLRFGKGHFVIPSPYFDIAVGPDETLRAVNPGKHRVETYTFDGRLLDHWGHASYQTTGFCGCCNPVYLKLLPDGRYLTSEKGLTRIKLHAPDGKLLGVIAGPAELGQTITLAEQAAQDCRLGCGFDIAVNHRGQILILDPGRKQLRIYEVPA